MDNLTRHDPSDTLIVESVEGRFRSAIVKDELSPAENPLSGLSFCH